MNEDYTELRNAQLASYRAEQEALKNKFPNYTNTPKIPVSTLITNAGSLLNEITALNIGNLNLRGNTQRIISQELSQKVEQLYLLLKEIKVDNGYTGKII